MLELHLFVNPLGMRCLRCEKDVLKIDRDLNTIPMILLQDNKYQKPLTK